MYKKSFFLALLSVISVGLVITASGYVSKLASNAPSKYDNGLTVEEAASMSKKPLLIEFYSDSCGTCRTLTPMIHNVQGKYADRVTFVMVNVYDKKQSFVAELFKVNVIPSVFLFQPDKMQKIQIPAQYLYTEAEFGKGIERGLGQLNTCIADKNALPVCRS